MKLTTYRLPSDRADQLGRLDDDRIIPLNMSAADFYARGLPAIQDLHYTPMQQKSTKRR